MQRKVDSIAESIKKIPRNFSKEQLIGEINRINSQVRGIIQYYQCCTWVSVALRRHSHRLQMIAKDRLKQYSGRWIPANQTQNLPHVHQKHQQKIPSIKYRDIYVGFTALSFCQWEMTPLEFAVHEHFALANVPYYIILGILWGSFCARTPAKDDINIKMAIDMKYFMTDSFIVNH